MRILSDPGFWHSLWMTVWYTALVVAGSTVLGLAVAMFFNREFRLRKTARSLVILSYVTPSISLVFARKYMFNNGYGIVNYLGVDLLHLYEQAPLWFDNPGSSFVLVVLFAIWRYFPYAFISFLAILQTIDKSLYEAAEMDGANARQRFRIVTLPAIILGHGDGGDPAHHLDVLHVRGCLFADDQGRYSRCISLQNRLCL